MKTAILLIWLYKGGMTSQVVPAALCADMATQARQEATLSSYKVDAKCIYERLNDEVTK